ncbi:hypothetical protein EW145_g6009 [Phellinidium pouzarii]|uniref:Peptidase A1 domain-containing protein n=1 Tax=Phellinidium pouzarii TaxID=167371 RepID=A0A4S4L2T1_9AGAM|nr:hypothetical protein EW145_g6009 [Phellinidium pouzarii]
MAGIVDTGTMLLYLASDVFTAYQKATGMRLDETTGLLKLSSSKFKNLKLLFFMIGRTTFEWTANAQIWPCAMNAQLGGEEGTIYLTTADNGMPSRQGLDFINGFVWLQCFYTVFDMMNQQVGVTTMSFTDVETN